MEGGREVGREGVQSGRQVNQQILHNKETGESRKTKQPSRPLVGHLEL